jgi:hypothetical protein
MKRITKWILLACVALFLAGCNTLPISSKNYVAGDKIPAGYGVVVAHLHSNWRTEDPKDFKTLLVFWVHSTDSKNYTHFALRVNDFNEWKVIPVPEGRYYISSLRLGNWSLPFRKDSAFDIKAGQISYIGDIHTRILMPPYRARLKVSSRPEYTKRILQEKYPDLLKSMEYKAEHIRLLANK